MHERLARLSGELGPRQIELRVGAGRVGVRTHLLVAVDVESVRRHELVPAPTRSEYRFEPPPFGATEPSIFFAV